MKLHLGCGQKYLEGYVNIDYPPAEHTVQNTSVADEYYDIRGLKYNAETIDEVRLHHVFEHFERFNACAYLASWNSWLKTGGKIHIEVPDFEMTIRKNFSILKKKKYESIGLRHIFGSQEAPWAVHYEGYSEGKLKQLAQLFGFGNTRIVRSDYKRTYNIELIAEKVRSLNEQECLKAATEYLSSYMIDDSDTEKRMLAVWLERYKTQFNISFAG
jgi:hypothetical protein